MRVQFTGTEQLTAFSERKAQNGGELFSVPPVTDAKVHFFLRRIHFNIFHYRELSQMSQGGKSLNRGLLIKC
jgi:hypothetical protein